MADTLARPESWTAPDGSVWLWSPATGDWTGCIPGEDGCWVKSPGQMDTVYPGHPWPTVADLERPPAALADLLAAYLEARQHTLSTAHLTGWDQLLAEASYVLGEALELRDAVMGALYTWHLAGPERRVELMRAIGHEVADVALADTTFAEILSKPEWAVWMANLEPVTVERCIAEKTEADRGRG